MVLNYSSQVLQSRSLCIVKIDDVRILGLLDTGASVTLIDKEAAKPFIGKYTPRDETPNIRVTSVTGQTISTEGPFSVPIQVGPLTLQHDILLCQELPFPCIIGNDFIKHHGMVLDCANNIIKCKGHTIPMAQAGSNNGVYTASTVVIPPRTLTTTYGRVVGDQLKPGSTVAVETSGFDDEDLSITPVVSTAHEEGAILLELVNMGDTEVKLEPGCQLGIAAEVKEEDLVDMAKGWPVRLAESTSQQGDGNEPTWCPEQLHLGSIAEEDKERITTMLQKHAEAFSFRGELGRCKLMKHRIELTSGVPTRRPPYKVPETQRKVMENCIHEMLDQGVIEPTVSPFSSPVVLVPKKNGEWRFCVDYRALNSITKPDNFALPLASDIFSTLGGAKVMSTLDLDRGFWQVEVDEEDKEKTAFTSFLGSFAFRVMPFGLRNSPSTYQRLMSHVLSGYTGVFCHVFIDDIIVYSQDMTTHLQHLEKVITRVQEAGLKLKPKKCHFACSTVKYLGHIVSEGNIKPDPENTRVVEELKPPENPKQVKSFCGLASYYRAFIKGFSHIARPLTALTKKNVKFEWGPAQQHAFDRLKVALTSDPILKLPNFEEPFTLMTDASSVALGAVLAQGKADPKGPVIAYASKALTSREQAYSSTELEILALLYGCNHFRSYLLGRKVYAITDHWALKWISTLKSPNPRLQRWALALQEYDLEVIHRSGANNTNCDFLSRLEQPVERCQDGSTQSVLCSLFKTRSMEEAGEQEHDEPLSTATECKSMTSQGEMQNRAENLNQVEGRGDIANRQEQEGAEAVDRDQQLQKEPDGELREPSSSNLTSDGSELNREKVLQWQRKDEDCQLLRKHVHGAGEKPEWAADHWFRISGDDLLEEVTVSRSGEVRHKLCVPKKLLPLVLKEAHQGHLGTKKTVEKMRSRYFFKHMYSTAEQYVKTCEVCQTKDRGKKPRAPLGDMPTPKGPWGTVSLDYLGPLPTTTGTRKQYILVITDCLTKFPLAIATKDQTAQTTVNVLQDKFLEYGAPEILLSDNGPAFRSTSMRDFCDGMGIKQVFTSPYSPSTNGLVERFNGTLARMLRAFVAENQSDWDRYLPEILFAYRTATQESTRETPFFLMFGRDAKTRLDHCLGDDSSATESAEEARTVMTRRLHDAFQLVQSRLKIVREKQRDQYNKRSKYVRYQVGDAVLLLDERVQPGMSKKLHRCWKPGYRVVGQTGPLTYLVEHPMRRGDIRKAHTNRLKPFLEARVLPEEPAAEGRAAQDRLEQWQRERQRQWEALEIPVQPPPTWFIIDDQDDPAAPDITPQGLPARLTSSQGTEEGRVNPSRANSELQGSPRAHRECREDSMTDQAPLEWPPQHSRQQNHRYYTRQWSSLQRTTPNDPNHAKSLTNTEETGTRSGPRRSGRLRGRNKQ